MGGETRRETEEEVAREVQGLPLPCLSASRGKSVDGSWSLVCLTNTWFSQKHRTEAQQTQEPV